MTWREEGGGRREEEEGEGRREEEGGGRREKEEGGAGESGVCMEEGRTEFVITHDQ